MTKIHRLAAVTITLLIAPLGAQAQPPTLSPEAAQGQAIAFDRLKGNCLACHTMRGSDVPSNVGPMSREYEGALSRQRRSYRDTDR